MRPIANQTDTAGILSPAEPELAARIDDHQHARQAAKRGLLWLGLVYLGFLCGSVGMAVDQIAHPFGG